MARTMMMMVVVGLVALSLAPFSARAEEVIKPILLRPTIPKPAKKGKKLWQGWKPFLTVGSNISIGQSTNVVGQPDGTTVSLGAIIQGKLNYRRGRHLWLNTLNINVQFTKTPQIDEFIKSQDTFVLESTYLNSLPSIPWLSFYAGASVATNLFWGQDVRSAPFNYEVIELGNAPRTGETGVEKAQLTHALSPTLLKQAAGLDFKLWDKKKHRGFFKAGVGFIEAFVRNGVAIADDKATPNVIEYRRLEDYRQAGAQAKLELSGSANEWMTYSFLADLLFPFYNSVTRGLSGLGLVNAEILLKLGFKLTKWASLSYTLGAKRVPLVADVWQITNGLLISFAFNIIK